ncbi:hypothetical protein J2Y69_002978 [Microbacterium resistens]|uniref:Peptidase_C39 like family protein n=1 Tax=Microbacterium resistens TaxID=156977 RepID=A0ABU1SFG3_9MICO|nr:peptidase C39 family protein [Microbacterium resistens]MDR6868362.1 hypothetical protein [Microbacterium resistens]
MSGETTTEGGTEAVVRTAYDRDAALDPRVSALLTEEAATRWALGRSGYAPILYTLSDGERTAALLTSARPGTGALKIVDLLTDDASLGVRLLAAVVEDARSDGRVCVKWETRDRRSIVRAEEHGFVPLPAPIRSGPGTEQPEHAFVLWLDGSVAARPIPYYRQTVEYTCGPVSSLLGAALLAPARIGVERTWNENHDVEMAVWRRATMSFPCEPYGLVVALREALLTVEQAGIQLFTDRETPFVVPVAAGFRDEVRAALSDELREWYDAELAEFRTRTVGLQDDLRRRARELGIPVRAVRLTAREIAQEVEGGGVALVMISQGIMHPGNGGGHWIVLHGTAGGMLLAQDPWVDADAGETWVDGSLLPIPEAALDEMSLLGGAEPYRAVILLSPPDADRS